MTPVPEPTTVGTTRFYVFRASDDLTVFTHVGTHEAANRDQAIRKQYGKTPPLCVAVSEHQWHVKKPNVVPVVRGLADVSMPEPGGPTQPDPEDSPIDESESLEPDPLELVPPVEDVA